MAGRCGVSLNGERTHDRCVAVCFLDGSHLAAEMVRAGLARDCPAGATNPLRRKPPRPARRSAGGTGYRTTAARVDPPGRRPIEAQHGGAIVLGVAAVLEILGTRIERPELVEQPVVGCELDHSGRTRPYR